MSVSSLTSLLEWLEIISRSPNIYRSSLLNQYYLGSAKEWVTSMINILKRLEAKVEYGERMEVEKEKIAAIASEVEHSFQADWIAHLPHNEIFARLQYIEDKIHFMTRQLPRSSISHYYWHVSTSVKQLQYAVEAGGITDIAYNEICKRLVEIDCTIQHLLRSLGQQFSDFREHSQNSIAEELSSSDADAYSKGNFLSVGLEESLKLFRLQLTGSSSKLEMFGIVGMAGIGKTTLAKMVFQDLAIIQHFDIRAWVKSSQSHTKTDMLLQLLKFINQQRNYDSTSQTEDCLEEELYRSLKGQRYLIVVDDLWSVQAWNEIRRPCSDDSMGSRILFTTRQSNVIGDLNCRKIHHMSLLDEESSWELLRKKVFGQGICPPDLIDTGKQIAKKCQGLPLAIVVISGILLKISMKLESWVVIAESFSSLVLSSTNSCQQMFALSYKHLPAYLKSCFLYMGAFPGEGLDIEARTLARLWIAEGFVIRKDSDLEQVAQEYLNDLVDRSLVLATSKMFNGNVKTCRLHDLLQEFCINQAREDKFLDVIKIFREEEDSGGEEEIENCEKEEDIDEVPLKKLTPCRFSFHCNTFENIPPKSQACTALFTVCSREVADILLYYLDFKSLVVLDMIPLRFDSFPEEQVSKLSRLRYLALTVSFELPSVVFRLSKLETLIVNDSRIKSDTTFGLELPLEFWTSINLRHMQLQVANYLPNPDDKLITKLLVMLQTLSKVTLSSFLTVETFACIPNVTKLGVCETMEDFRVDNLWNRFFENVGLLSRLESLKVYCLQMNNGSPKVLPIPSPPAFPENLRKLTLSRSHMPWKKMEILGRLPNLEVLKLRNYAFQGPEWETRGGFQRLNYLLIENTDLKSWSLEYDDCFPRLQRLVLKFCRLLEEIPEEIGDIPTLSCMELIYCNNSSEQSAKHIQDQQEEYGHNIEVHIR